MLPILRRRHVVAVDLGSSGTRIWAADVGHAADVPGLGGRPAVRHGLIVDPGATAQAVGPLVGGAAVVTAVSDRPFAARGGIEALLRSAGAFAVTFVDPPLAAAIGAGLDISDPVNELVVDIGAGLLHVGVVGNGTVRAQRVLAWGLHDTSSPTRGPDVAAVVQRTVEVAVATLDAAPASVAADVVARGAVLVGGGGAVAGLPERLTAALRMPVRVAADPTRAVLRGLIRLCTAGVGHSQPPLPRLRREG